MSLYRLLAVAAAAMFCSAGQAGTIYVDVDNCPGPGDGTEADPYCSIQTAMDAALSGDEIVIAPGTYFEFLQLYYKEITLRSSDGPEVTVIHSPAIASVLLYYGGEGQHVQLHGLTFTGGRANAGAGVDAVECVIRIEDCVFVANVADISGGWGGGLHVGRSVAFLKDCVFEANESVIHGGGVYVSDSIATIANCTFVGNASLREWGAGGGAIGFADSEASVIDCEFRENSATLGGAVAVAEFADGTGVVTFTGCSFMDNSAHIGTNWGGRGGAAFNQGADVTMIGCTFENNHALPNVPIPSRGGALFCSHGGVLGTSLMLANCQIRNNHAEIGGAVLIDDVYPTLTMVNSTLSGNTATQVAGGVWMPGYGTITNSIIWGNSDPSGSGQSAQIHVEPYGYLLLDYSCVQGLTGDLGGIGNIGADPLFVDPGNGDLRLQPASPCIDAADNGAVPGDIITDLDGNPRFLDVPETPDTGLGELPVVDMGAYESLGGGCLAITSLETVCVGEGPAFVVNVEGLNACTGDTVMLTFTGSGGAVGEDFCATLIVNTAQGGFCCSTQVCVPVPDCSPSPPPCDIDGDYEIGVTDFLAMLNAWGPNPGHPADLDGDGTVAVGDFLLLLANWGSCP